VKTTFIAWTRYHRRSELLAQHMAATIHFIYSQPSIKLKFVQTPLRYAAQSLQTWHVLRQDRPDIIFVQNPPIFCALVAFLYTRWFGGRYVIDSHTGAFRSSKWRWSLGLHRFLSKGALTTIVHNSAQEKIVKEWGCRYLVLKDPIFNYPEVECFPFVSQFNVAVPSSFQEDEPLCQVFEAAALLPEVSFYITGNSTRIAKPLLSQKPANCYLTGYLPYERYVGLLRGVDAIMVLTIRDQTLLCGAFEAVSLGTPLIVSDWPVLRDCFSLGTVYVPNTVKGIREGVCQVRSKRTELKREILVLREQLQVEGVQKLSELQSLVSYSK
jgi:glycosyltransferase involved in cell wall biosynthesis